MATSTVNEAHEILDMHGAYRTAHECGFGSDLLLKTQTAGDIAARLRGISGITAVLMTDRLDVDLGDYVRGALIEAVNALSNDCANDLEESRDLQEKAR
jgi:hypothetical protein